MSDLNREIESEVVKINTFVEEKLSKDKILSTTWSK